MNAGRLRFFPPTSAKKDRDEELALFRELFKREKEKNTNLLDAVSTEFEPIDGNSVVYKISSGKKGDGPGNENEKNDYDWLKTPPATPLFQSLEMDVGQVNNTNLIVQKELPIISPLKPSRFSEKMEMKTSSKPPTSPSISSFRSASSSRPETPDPLSPPRRLTTPITTPRFGGSQRFIKESDRDTPTLTTTIMTPRFIGAQLFAKESIKETFVKPLQSGRFLRKKEEPNLIPQSPSTATSSRPESPNTNPNPPFIRRTVNVGRAKEEPKPIERPIKRFSKEGDTKQVSDKKLQNQQVTSYMKPGPTSPSSRSLASTASSRTSVSGPTKSKDAPKYLEKPVKKIIKEAPPKKNSESKPNGQTISPIEGSRFPATLHDFPTDAPPNLITSVAPGRATSATRSRPGVPVMASVEQRPPSAAKGRGPSTLVEVKGNEKRGGSNKGVVIGSSMVEKMMNARRSTATSKVNEDKVSKIRGSYGQASK